jgi:hypothetical protein
MRRPKKEVVSARVIPDKLRDFDHDAIMFVYKVDGVEVRAIHWSGRFDGDLKRLARWLREIAHEYDAHYITTTETQQKGANAAIRAAFGPGWGLQRSGEYALIYKRSIFSSIKRLKPHTIVATKIKNWALWRQMHVGFFNIRHKKLGLRFRIPVIHGPSAIENGRDPKRGKQWDIAVSGWPRLGRSLKRFQKLHPRSVQVPAADTNGDHHIPDWMERFEHWLGAKSIWRGRLPNRGTHAAGRLIDGAWLYDAD